MERLKQKLNSRRGASILLALLMMMVAVMISAVIISASVTAVNRVSDDKDQQQGVFSASSAARYFADALRNAECVKITEIKHTFESKTTNDPITHEETTVIVETIYPAEENWTPVSEDGSNGVINVMLKQFADRRGTEGNTYDCVISPPASTSMSPAIVHFSLHYEEDGFVLSSPVVYAVSSVEDRTKFTELMEDSEYKVKLKDVFINYTYERDNYYFGADYIDRTTETWKVNPNTIKLTTAGG